MHIPVLLEEVIDGLSLEKGDIVFDATVGDGGHAKVICERIGKFSLPAGRQGKLIGIDEDDNVFKAAEKNLHESLCDIKLKKANFRNLDIVLADLGIEQIDKVFFDLGLRSEQLEESGRGFSFRKDEPLIMTFDSSPESDALTAREIINKWPEKEIIRILREYGEERFARRIAHNIVETRENHPIERTTELVDLIGESIPARFRYGRLHFATKTFQALRIAVNDELESLKIGLMKACNLLSDKGRIAVISFHSLEDRIVKHFFIEKEKTGDFKKITKKPIIPTEEEIILNPRARSAKLRILEKL